MPISADILDRRTDRFVIWIPSPQATPPRLIIGTIRNGNPPTFIALPDVVLAKASGAAGETGGLWEIPAAGCGLTKDVVYHYWFEVDDSRSTNQPKGRVAVTDPFSCCVDWRLFPPGTSAFTQPASVIKYLGEGKLAESDPNGESPVFTDPDNPAALPPNNALVIYELPTAWAMSRSLNEPERGAATFLDLAALVDESIPPMNFAGMGLGSIPRYLASLGVNAVELLPPADSFFKREWGYGTSHYLAPDFELGYPEGNLAPTANRDLAVLVNALHRKGIRFLIDVVMAFAKEDPYNRADAGPFHIDDPEGHPDDVDAKTSGRGEDGHKETRNGFGSTLWRYSTFITTYDPVSGTVKLISPAQQYMLVYLIRWMRDFRVDGIRIDSAENVANWDFLEAFKKLGRDAHAQRWQDAGLNPIDGADARFLVVGEELSLPKALLTQQRLDGLWNDAFQSRIRAALLGQSSEGDDFEFTIKKAIDCISNGGKFTDGAQAVNYLTKHDVEGFRHERLFTMLRSLDDEQIEKRIKLGFACLMTAVGIPMFLAGEEFGDEHDLFDFMGNVTQNGGKQIDPVNFSRCFAGPTTKSKDEDRDGFYGPMRRRILAYVKTLIALRIKEPALSVNDTSFIWTDFGDGKRVFVWQRGNAALHRTLIVVANFSDFGSAQGADYVIPTWPNVHPPAGFKWVELTQGPRDVNPAFVGREAIFPWEAKIYAMASI
ncbi:MAG TPA: alpha-amylase family glycosyl hydrolase [Gemmataceae bacterium]|nr:alpha-amylase family glycosyl hydrolase [Gemmataceae bacterium]